MKENKNRKKVNLVELGSYKYLKKLRFISACKGLRPYPGKCPCCGVPKIPGGSCPNCGNKYLY